MGEPSDKEIFDQIEKKFFCKLCPEMLDSEREVFLHVRDKHYD